MNDFLKQTFGESLGLVAEIAGASIVVLAVFLALVWLVRRLSRLQLGGLARGRVPRLAVVDATAVDSRRKLVLVRRDNVEHLILIGGPSDVVVETGIQRVRPRAAAVPATPGASAPSLVPAPAVAAAPTMSPAAATAQEESDPPLPFPFPRIPPAEPADDSKSETLNGGGLRSRFTSANPRFARKSDSQRVAETDLDDEMLRPTSPFQPAGPIPPPPLAAEPMRATPTPPPPADSSTGEDALRRVSELEAEMNRLLGQITVERRTS